MIITYRVNEHQLDRAKMLYPFDALNGSITKGEGNLYGALAEVVVHDHFRAKGHNIDYQGNYDYDIIIDGHKVDVKAKHIKVTPKPYHNAGIVDWNINQECDYYFFAFTKKDLSEVYLLGYMGKEEFYKKATFNKKGEEDWNGWKFKANTYNVKVEALHSFAQ